MLQARGNNIIVSPIDEDKVNGVFIPPHFKRSVQKVKLATVYSSGPDAPVKNGDIVVVGLDVGEEFTYEGKELVRVRPNSIQAIK